MLTSEEVPITIKDKLLIEPGRWNNILYTEKEIRDAFENTDWNDKERTSLILDHDDGINSAVKNWVGYVRNTRLIEGGKLIGDLEVWNPLIALYLTKAKAKFGISAKLRGDEDKTKLRNFTFENFSIVTRPAVRTAYINLSDNSQLKSLKGGLNMTSEELKKLQNDEENAEEVSEEDLEELKKKQYPKPVEEVSKVNAKPAEDLCPKVEEQKGKPKPKDEALSEIEILEITINSDWTDFVKQMKAKDPNMSFQDIAKAYKAKQNSDKTLESLSDEELLSQLNKLSEILKKKGKYPYPEDPKKVEEQAKVTDDEMKKKEEEIKKKEEDNKKLHEEIKELQAKLDTPDSKTVTLSDSKSQNVDPLQGMADWLIQNAGKGGRIF